jgi:hypothetical protein
MITIGLFIEGFIQKACQEDKPGYIVILRIENYYLLKSKSLSLPVSGLGWFMQKKYESA